MSVEEKKETLDFQAEVRQLLDLMVHSLYGNKEIFLRELASNASDAADKLRFEALTNDALYEGDGELKIRVSYDKAARTLTVSDNGIGMSREEVIENLGTIAKSGTRQFFQALTGDEAKDAQLIGQFGVGFYSSFIIADKVTVLTRRAGAGAEDGVRWESDGQGAFTVEAVARESRGTDVVLHLRDGEDEFLDGYRLRSIIRKYSDHVSLPILMPKEGDGEEEGEDKAETGGDETVNSATALWIRAKHEIKDEEYDEFYKHVSHDFEAPLAHVHSRVEGNLEYTSLLFVPARAPFDLWDRGTRRGVKLYVRRVFIMDDAEQLMPPYLRFVRGVIDSSDLPLNISREILQQNKQIDAMRSGSVKKVLGLLESMAKDDQEKYATFWKEFGRAFKEGIIDDGKNRDAIAKLLRFASTQDDSEEQNVSLEDYLGRMQEGQDKIYYLTANSPAAAKSSPHLEVFKDKGVEVLLMTDEVDEWVVSHLTEFEEKALQSVTRGELDLGDIKQVDASASKERAKRQHKGLVKKIKDALGERVKDVRITDRLTTSPACLVADEHDMGGHLERILRQAGQEVPGSKPIMELNLEHPIVQRLDDVDDAGQVEAWSHILFDQATLSEGGKLDDPAAFVRRTNEMFLAMGAAAQAEAPGSPAEGEQSA